MDRNLSGHCCQSLELLHLSTCTGIIHSTSQPGGHMMVPTDLLEHPSNMAVNISQMWHKKPDWSLLHNCDPRTQWANFRKIFILVHDATGSAPVVRTNLMATRVDCEWSSVVAYRKQRERSLGTKYKNLKRHCPSYVQPSKTFNNSQNKVTNIVVTASL